VDGKTHYFRAAKTAILEPTRVEEVEDSPYALTVFTCIHSGKSRFVLYCEKS
jgi:sortase (surface protein transpeptidase)